MGHRVPAAGGEATGFIVAVAGAVNVGAAAALELLDQIANWAATVCAEIEPRVVHGQEYPLGPAVVGRVGGVHLALPIVAKANGLKLAAEIVDIPLGGDARVDVGFHGVLLGGQPEGIPPHRVQHIEPTMPLVAGNDVGSGVAFRVADMQAVAGRIWEHIKDVALWAAAVVGIGAEGSMLQPVLLPALFDFGKVVRHIRAIGLFAQCITNKKQSVVSFC